MAIPTTPDRVPAAGTSPGVLTAPPLKLPHVSWRAWLPIAVTLALALLPAPAGLPQHAWYFFAIFAGVIVALMLEPLPGGAVGLIGVTVVSVLAPWVLYAPAELAKPGFSSANAALGWALSGFSNGTVWLIFGAFMFALGYEKTGLGKRIAKEMKIFSVSDVASLDGLGAFPHLTDLKIVGGPRLADISALLGRDQLQTLYLQACPRLTSLTALHHCTSLRVLNLAEGGQLDSAAPLADLTNLEELYLYGTTVITDGDLTPIAGLPKLRELRIQNRRHYRPSARNIQAAL